MVIGPRTSVENMSQPGKVPSGREEQILMQAVEALMPKCIDTLPGELEGVATAAAYASYDLAEAIGWRGEGGTLYDEGKAAEAFLENYAAIDLSAPRDLLPRGVLAQITLVLAKRDLLRADPRNATLTHRLAYTLRTGVGESMVTGTVRIPSRRGLIVPDVLATHPTAHRVEYWDATPPSDIFDMMRDRLRPAPGAAHLNGLVMALSGLPKVYEQKADVDGFTPLRPGQLREIAQYLTWSAGLLPRTQVEDV